MNRVSVASSAAISFGSMLSTLFSMNALAAEPLRQPSPAALQQRLESAQRRLDRAAQEVADLSESLSERSNRRLQGGAVLGIDIATDADAERNDGVKVLSVRPGGGAYEAGLKSGDLLLAVNNERLKRDDDVSPGEKLLAIMRGVTPGDKLAVKYRREGFIKTTNVIARPLVRRPTAVVPPVVRVQRIERVDRNQTPRVAVLQAEGILGGAELVPLTPRLGKYFGTDKGLLVVRAPADDSLDIREGDVILNIDGRIPTSTAQAMRILSSYQPGEELSLSLFRSKRSFDIDLVIPQSAPAADLEQQPDRSRSTAPRLSRAPRANAVTPQPPAPAQAEAEPEDVQIQPLPDDDVEVQSQD